MRLASRCAALAGAVALAVATTSAAPVFSEFTFASSLADDRSFGHAVSIDGDTVVVGAPDLSGGTGSASVFVRENGVWIEQARLLASDGALGDRFGESVSVSGDTVIIGAPGDDTSAGLGTGSAHVFVRIGGSWFEQARLSQGAGGVFGAGVAVEGDTAVIGAPASTGTAYVFVRSGTTWALQDTLDPDDPELNDHFGSAVDISGSSAVVGAWGVDTGAGSDSGAMYVFVRDGATWTQQAKLLAGDEGELGRAVAIDADTAIGGAPVTEDSAYVFVRAGATWTMQAVLREPAPVASDLGRSVALSGNTAVVGDPIADSERGTAVVFRRSGAMWSRVADLVGGGNGFDRFGTATGVSGDTAVVGAPAQERPDGSFGGITRVFVDATAADLKISQGQDTLSLKQGDLLTYTVTVENVGPNRASNVVVSDTLSSGAVFAGATSSRGVISAPPVGQNGTVTWTIPELLPSDTEAAQIRVTVILRGKGSTITNAVSVESDTADPNVANNTSSLTTTVLNGKKK